MFRKRVIPASFRISILYLLIGGAWVFFSDKILAVQAEDRAAIIQFSIAKGLLFVSATAAMLFVLISRSMKEISQSRDFYLKVFEEFPALIWRAGTDGACDYLNKTWLAFTGRTREQELGYGWAEGVHPEDLGNCLNAYREAFDSRNPFVLEYRLRRHDGEYRWILDSGRPYYDQHDKFAGYIGSCYDMTEHKRTEQALAQSERRFRDLTENTSDWIWEVGRTLRYVYVSPKITDLLGHAPADVLGKTPFDLMPPDEAARLRPAFDEFMKDPRPFAALENVNVRRDGSLVVLETSGIPLYDAEGQFSGFRGIDRDISARKAAEERINTLNAELAAKAAELEVANRELEAFAHTVSHDLRTPLTNITLSCQVMREICKEKNGDQCNELIQGICNAAERMDRLITSLLNFARISRSPLNVQPVDLSEMARVIAAELQLNQPDRRVTFIIAEGITARGDGNLLHIVLTNLLGNAWKYTRNRETAVIEFGMTEIEGKQAYFVRDNGAGFDMNQADKLFGAFQRLHSAKEYEGYGIGLATVKRIVQRHGGSVWAAGEVEKGATFYFTLAPEWQGEAAPSA
ncbi:sensor histidine kinase [Geomobilimonas luticola]|uniref:histidine kinase n=1 Tax=Geomobilimonas luticola TaxID=1114878 RepID=A0ABS5SDH1_9BACT|nr:PAS domain-containing sensor histidine kinase [Geomobilimonas luticola]MBT0653423.1 PAS domain S-box protein [Geomobilimonas luticola]